MLRKLSDVRVLLSIVAIMALVALVGCASDEGTKTPATAAPAPTAALAPTTAPAPTAAPVATKAPATAVPAATTAPSKTSVPTAPTATSAPAKPEPTRAAPQPTAAPSKPKSCYILGDVVTACPDRSPHTWQSPPQVPGEYWGYQSYSGPKPTKFYESPMSYQLVMQGKLPPLEERLPIAEDVMVVQGPDGIGEYGGTYRQTCYYLYLGEWILASWSVRDSNGTDWYPWAGKDFKISSDGRTWTFTLRNGAKWSDGSPLDIEDIRYAWEDLNYNTEMNPVVAPEFRDPVTNNKAAFKVVDNLHWTLTFDTPNYNLMELRSTPSSHCMASSFCMYSPKYMKQFDPRYGDKAAIAKMISDAGFETWVQLYSNKANVTVNPDKPCLSAWCTYSVTTSMIEARRNHYYYGVDPEGNQLPYMDAAMMIAMESREVAVFRAMNGENDGQTSIFMLNEAPLLNANMEKGDYSLYHWPSEGGSDAAMTVNQTWNTDPEIGRWIRTKEFRDALSLATNREAINNTVFLGLGQIQSWTPHPDTFYYPGPEVATMNTEFNIAKANQILDGLGLTAKNPEGYRLRLDGKGPIALYAINGPDEGVPVTEIMQNDWKDIGIKLDFKASGDSYTQIRANKEYLGVSIDASAYQGNPWSVDWTMLAPMRSSNHTAVLIGMYVETVGKQGMQKTADPTYLPIAPAGNFPADVSGNLARLVDIWQEGRAFTMYSPERRALAKEMFTKFNDEQYAISTVGFTGSRRGVFLNRNNMLNQPKTHVRDHNGFHAWTYYFEGGKDNLTHPDNKSATQKSWSFLGGQ